MSMAVALPTANTALSSSNIMASAMAARVMPRASIDAAAREFEAMFASQLVKPMFDTVPVDDMFGGGQGEEVMRALLVQEYGKAIAQSGTLGIASHVKDVMLRAQEAHEARSLTKRGEAKKVARKDNAAKQNTNTAVPLSSGETVDERLGKERLDVAY